MTLQEIFDQLTYGELSQVSIGGGEVGAITEANYPRILAHINLALTAIYKRFPLNERQLNFQLQPNLTTYQLKVADLLKVERVFTDGAFDLQLNNDADSFSCHTPSMNILRVPKKMVDGSIDIPDKYKTTSLTAVYRADHPKIVQGLGYFDPNRVTLQLPSSHLEPLLLFVASRVMSPMGAGQFEGLAGNNYFAKYEASCQQIEGLNLKVDQDSQNTRLERNGWV